MLNESAFYVLNITNSEFWQIVWKLYDITLSLRHCQQTFTSVKTEHIHTFKSISLTPINSFPTDAYRKQKKRKKSYRTTGHRLISSPRWPNSDPTVLTHRDSWLTISRCAAARETASHAENERGSERERKRAKKEEGTYNAGKVARRVNLCLP